MVAALAGAGLQILGAGISANGQARAGRAMHDQWMQENQRQSGFDDSIQARIQQHIANLGSVGPVDNSAGTDLRQTLGNAAVATNRAGIQSVNRRTAGSRGSAVSRAAAKNAQGTNLAKSLRDAKLAGILESLMSGNRRQGLLGQEYNRDVSDIRSDARDSQSLMRLREQRAGLEGQSMRQLGNTMNIFGSGLTSFGMSQPSAPSQVPTWDQNTADLWAQQPVNGWGSQARGVA